MPRLFQNFVFCFQDHTSFETKIWLGFGSLKPQMPRGDLSNKSYLSIFDVLNGQV